MRRGYARERRTRREGGAMQGPRHGAYEPRGLMREAESWRDMLAEDPDGTVPLLVAWTAWRWAGAAERLIAHGGRQYSVIAVITLLAHARILLDLLDAGHVNVAATVHARATYGAERLDEEMARTTAAFTRWRAGGRAGPLGRMAR